MPSLALPSVPPALLTFFERSHVALSLAQAQGDAPLMAVNEPFLSVTGFTAAEILGRNCRHLQRNADNREARQAIRNFLADEQCANVRQTLINFKADGMPFVNLLYMSRLRGPDGKTHYFFASQFDVSNAHADMLEAYDSSLDSTLREMKPAIAEFGIIVEGSLVAIANSAALIAQAKLTLAEARGGAIL